MVLDKERAFKYRKTIHAKSTSSPSFSFLDITSALQQYLQFIVSSTRNSSLHYSWFLLQKTNYSIKTIDSQTHYVTAKWTRFHSHQTNGTLSLFRTLNLYPIRNTQIQWLSLLSLSRRLYEMKWIHHHKVKAHWSIPTDQYHSTLKTLLQPFSTLLIYFRESFCTIGGIHFVSCICKCHLWTNNTSRLKGAYTP